MWVSTLTKETLTDDIIDRLLYDGIQDTGESADCILVLGSNKAAKYRVPLAADVYNAGRSDYIVVCGGTKWSFPEGTYTEAEYMYETLLALGIPKEHILMENNSKNTVENFLCALLELQRSLWLNKVHQVLLITTTYHMRRSLALAKYLFPAHIRISPCPADDTNTTRSSWRNSEKGRKRAIKEALNIVQYIKNGVIPDFEI